VLPTKLLPALLASLLAGFAGLLVHQSRAEACVIEAAEASVDQVSIAPPGESAFTITLHKLPMDVKPGAKGNAELSVKAPLLFTTQHSMHQLPVRFARRTSLLGGRLVVGKGHAPGFTDRREAPTQKRIGARLGLQELKVDVPVEVPCSALTLSADTSLPSTPPVFAHPTASISYVQTKSRLPLYAARKERAPFWIRFHGPLQVIEQNADWVHVQAKWQDGSSLQGWVPRRLAKIRHGVVPQGEGAIGGVVGHGTCGRSHPPRLISFKLHAGAPIHTAAKGAIWAHTAASIKVRAFVLARSDGWIQIASIDGLPPGPCGEHEKFWVHAQHVLWTDTPLDAG
jgi:hypothetical protein